MCFSELLVTLVLMDVEAFGASGSATVEPSLV